MKYISILRGINVSGQKKIKMAGLRSLYESKGFENVTTYIQSGSVVFESKIENKMDIKSELERSITEQYGFYVPVDIRTAEEIKTIFADCPFLESEKEENGTKILVTFLSNIPEESNVSGLMAYVKPPEKLAIAGSIVYLHCPNGYGRSKLSNTFLEAKLNVKATTRNWKTVRKLYEMSIQ